MKPLTKKGFMTGIYSVMIISGFILLLGSLGGVEREAYPNYTHIYLYVVFGYGLLFGGGNGIIGLMRHGK